ncbi:Long_chain fatty acid CoA ligase [Hexamita inflata]|uniref:Long chain fatty acid CoA ligase n=1 Tax=Hexamita inflata TaxID=28002 RepID=A0AA86P595_9EUKA|nr:Long chain fatty acid CoA ligase [Hexamita inflata]
MIFCLTFQIAVRSHDFTSASHLPLQLDQEPDLTKTIPQNFMEAAYKYSYSNFLAYRAGLSTSQLPAPNYTFITYKQAAYYIHQIQRAIQHLTPGDRCAIYAKNSPLWLLSDIALQFQNIISAPVFDTLGHDNIVYALNLIQATCVIASGDHLTAIIGLSQQIPTLKTIISMDELNESVFQNVKNQFKQNDNLLFSFEDLFNGASNQKLVALQLNDMTTTNYLDLIQKSINTEQTAESASSVIFTSGTSGRPKALLVSHKNVLSGLASLGRQFVPYHLNDKGEQSSFISYLPLAHVFERILEHGAYKRGLLIYYSSGSIKTLADDLKLAKPSLMIGVPRVYSKMYEAFKYKLNQQSFVKRAVFNTAFELKKLYLKINPNAHKTGRFPLVEKVFKSIHESFGGNLEFIVSGSSSLQKEVREFLEVCSGARVTTGYGLTEANSAGLYNYCGQKYNSANQLGFSSYLVNAEVVDKSDVCEFNLEKDKIGELVISGPIIAIGQVDGKWGSIKKITDDRDFYHTGDLVTIHKDHSVSFLRRIGLVTKLQQGEFVDLEAVESALESSSLFTSALVHGESDKSALVCIASVSSSQLQNILGDSLFELYKEQPNNYWSQVDDILVKEGEKLVKQRGLKGFNVPRAYNIYLNTDWTSNPQFYTPSQKKKHYAMVSAFKKELDVLFAHSENSDVQINYTKNVYNFIVDHKFMVILILVLVLMFKIMK